MKRQANDLFLETLGLIVGAGSVLTSTRRTRPYRTGIRVGGGAALAVVLPQSLTQLWRVIKICVEHDKIIIMQAANTGLTAGSTPDGDDYDREVVIINTRKINDIVLMDGGKQILAFAGATLYRLEEMLKPVHRTPHSVIGSSCIGASIVGGVCNNSGGNLVNRGPAYTELSLFARLNEDGELELVNHLGIDLGSTPEEILGNLEQRNFDAVTPFEVERAASDREYQQRVREISASTPARYNADKRRLFEASGCAGKLAVFAVRLDTFARPEVERVFYIGTNDPTQLTALRKRILTEFPELPEMGEYMHRSYFDASARYCKDTFLFIRFLGSAFLPRLYSLKARVDGYIGMVPFLPGGFSDRVLQFVASLWPNHLPRRMRNYRDRYEHHLMIKANDDVIAQTRECLEAFFDTADKGAFFECDEREGESALLHRFVAGGAAARFSLMHRNEVGGILPFDIALRRDDERWHEILTPDVLDQLAGPFVLAHFFCLVFHHDFVVRKGVDVSHLKADYLCRLDERGARYPAEHNVGHLYQAEPDLAEFYRNLDPTNGFNAGVGRMSKHKHYA